MEQDLKNKMIAKARENGEKHKNITAELDFGAGAEWMHEQLINKLTLSDISNLRKWLITFYEWEVDEDDYASSKKEVSGIVDRYLSNNREIFCNLLSYKQLKKI